MEISVGSYKMRVEILVAIIVLFWVMFGHLLCSCCKVSLFEGFGPIGRSGGIGGIGGSGGSGGSGAENKKNVDVKNAVMDIAKQLSRLNTQLQTVVK